MLDYKEKYNKLVEAVKALQEANPSDEGIRNWVNDNVPELKEHEDKRIKTFIKGLLLPHIEDIHLVGDKIMHNKDIDIYRRALVWLEKQGNPTDKVEPKFKAGDWIVSKYGDLFQIKEIVAGGYKLLCPSGNEEINSIRNVDKSSYLWSIAKARPGNVLATSQSIFIFKGFYIANKPKAYCGIMNGSFINCPEGCWTNEQCYPATEEQRKLLFEKMAEAGYEWDAEKKELKLLISNGGDFEPELSHKEATKKSDKVWNDDDEKNLQGVIDEIQANKSSAPEYDLKTYDKFLSWLKSIKNRVQHQPKQDGKWKWEEDDEKFFKENILIELGNIDGVSPELYSKIIDWLNLIKKRLS